MHWGFFAELPPAIGNKLILIWTENYKLKPACARQHGTISVVFNINPRIMSSSIHLHILTYDNFDMLNWHGIKYKTNFSWDMTINFRLDSDRHIKKVQMWTIDAIECYDSLTAMTAWLQRHRQLDCYDSLNAMTAWMLWLHDWWLLWQLIGNESLTAMTAWLQWHFDCNNCLTVMTA